MTKNKNLSIVFITNNWIPYGAGLVNSLQAFRVELERQGHTVTIITLDFLGPRSKKEKGILHIYCPLRFTYAENPIAVPLFPTKQINKIIYELKPDIIHSHHPFLLGISALKVAKKYNIPCIFTYHTLYEHYTHYVPFFQNILKKLVYARVQRYCNAVDGIITPSSIIEKILDKMGVKTPRVCIPSPLKQIYISQNNRQCGQSTRLHVQEKRMHLMTCSRFVKEKNIPFLIKMFAGLDHDMYTFTLVGYGIEYDALQKYAYSTLKLSQDMVQFVERPSLEKLLSLYNASDVFLFSSLSDTQGLVLAEAMACGLPVVSLDGPGQRDIVINGENGFLVHNKEEMQAAISLIANNPDLYQHLSCNARETAKQYCPEILTQKLVAFYRTFL